MSKRHRGDGDVGMLCTLKYLKKGDVFNIHSGNNIYQRFTVLRADIVHKDHLDVVCANEGFSSSTLTLSSNYPFGRCIGDTPLRYVVYAERKLP